MRKEDWIGQKSQVGKGYIQLVDVMGSDSDIANAARVSYGAGTKSISDDEHLIEYLLRKGHTSPFEMAELKFIIQCPMDTWRQWIRHRTASVNEYSTRYSEAIEEVQTTNPSSWRKQATNNRQGSDGFLSVDLGAVLSREEASLHDHAHNVYKTRLECGVAREQARKDLPLSTYTKAYWKIDLHNLLHFLKLRMEPSAQQEIREFATIIGHRFVKNLFPITWCAFEKYVLNVVTLTQRELECLSNTISKLGLTVDSVEMPYFLEKGRKRELSEFEDKLKSLGFKK